MPPLAAKILVIHIAFALGCALFFWPPLFLNKGGRAHVLLGKVYSALLSLMIFTALLVTALSFVDAPAAAQRETTGMLLDPYRHDTVVYRIHLAFLAFVAIGTIQALAFGLFVLKARRSGVGAIVHAVLGTAGLAIIGCGIHLSFLPMIVVGLVGALMGAFFAVRTSRATQAARLPDHLTGLILSGILSYTAIAIVVANRTMPEFFHSTAGIVVWVLPTVLGLPAILLLRRRHGDDLAR